MDCMQGKVLGNLIHCHSFAVHICSAFSLYSYTCAYTVQFAVFVRRHQSYIQCILFPCWNVAFAVKVSCSLALSYYVANMP